MAIPKRCVGSKLCVLQFSIFSCAHLGTSARNLSKRPKWSTYVGWKVIGVKSLHLERLVDYSIQAKDIIIYFCAFQGTFVCLLPILPFFARHDVKWRPCISTLRSIDIMTQVCYEGTHFGAQHILNPANNSSWAWIPRPPCWRFGTIPNHGLTWRPCHSQNRRSWATPERYVGHI